jgi:hypothetical protein
MTCFLLQERLLDNCNSFMSKYVDRTKASRLTREMGGLGRNMDITNGQFAKPNGITFDVVGGLCN